MDDVVWAALTLSLTVVGGIYTWIAFRRRGLAAGLRGAGFTLIPVALFLTDTLQLVSEIGGSVVDWATDLVFSPSTWLGMVVAGIAGVLFVVSGFLRRRQGDAEPRGRRTSSPDALPAGQAPSGPVLDTGVDAELAEIEALLRKRGIT